MPKPTRSAWLRAALLLGVGYAAIGIAFALPDTHVRAWRLAAWGLSAGAYLAHIVYERVRLRDSYGATALHVALAVAVGAFGLAVGANIHSLSVGATTQQWRLLLLSLAIWPVMTALPAFLVALVLSAVAARRFDSLQRRNGLG